MQVGRVTDAITKANELNFGDKVWSLALSRDGSRVVVGSADGIIWSGTT